jgi:hypothetical protein
MTGGALEFKPRWYIETSLRLVNEFKDFNTSSPGLHDDEGEKLGQGPSHWNLAYVTIVSRRPHGQNFEQVPRLCAWGTCPNIPANPIHYPH